MKVHIYENRRTVRWVGRVGINVDVQLVRDRHLHVVHLVDGGKSGQQVSRMQLVGHHFNNGNDTLRRQARVV
jgi:hypothetical protein